MRNDPAMLTAALRGYAGDVDDGGAFSSSVWLAHVAGRRLRQHGVSTPARVHKSRAYSVNIETEGGAQFRVRFCGAYLERVEVLRL